MGSDNVKNNLEEILDKQGRKKSWLAEQVGVEPNTISRIIKGAEPKLTNAYKIAEVLGVSVYDIWPPG